jgi:hypothetical protein
MRLKAYAVSTVQKRQKRAAFYPDLPHRGRLRSRPILCTVALSPVRVTRDAIRILLVAHRSSCCCCCPFRSIR